MSEILAGLVRHLLTAGAGVLVAKGTIDPDIATQLVGLGTAAVGIGWSVWAKRTK